MAICTDHGGVWGHNLYPSSDLLTQTAPVGSRVARYGALPHAPNAQGQVSFSPILTADASRLTPSVLSKMNVIRGLDIPYRIGHHRGGHLGNFADVDGQTTGGINNSAYQTATIDQFMAYSPSVYTADELSSSMTQRSFNLRSGRYSQNFTRPQAKSGAVVQQPAHQDNLELFNYLFNPGSALGGVDSYLIDRVKSGYDRLSAHPRLSRGDKSRLDQHVESMFEIERKLRVSAQLVEPPAPPETNSTYYSGSHAFYHSAALNTNYSDLMADMITLAFSAGISRIGTWSQDLKFTDLTINDWHGQIAHSAIGASAAQSLIIGWHQGTFEHAFVRLAQKLDAVTMEDGLTLLDHSLITLTSEAGQYTHHSSCVHYPVITVGGAGGYLNTGMFVDYGHQGITYTDLEVYSDRMPLDAEHPGLYYNQFLANILYAMGVPQAEFNHFRDFTVDGPERSEHTGGYGFHYVDPQRAADYLEARAMMSAPLPILTNA
jgi:hypothetical protein